MRVLNTDIWPAPGEVIPQPQSDEMSIETPFIFLLCTFYSFQLNLHDLIFMHLFKFKKKEESFQ